MLTTIGHGAVTVFGKLKKVVLFTSPPGAITQGNFGNDRIWGRGKAGRMLLQGLVQRLAMSSARAWRDISHGRWCYSVCLWQGDLLLLEIQVVTVQVSPMNSQTLFFA